MISKAAFAKALSHAPHKTPQGLKVWVQKKGRTVFQASWGKVFPYYDLASLTKIFFTTTALMRAVQEDGLSLEAPVSDFLPTRSSVRLEQFLNHTSGLEAWEPFYKSVSSADPIPWRWEDVRRSVFSSLPNSTQAEKSVYSDLNFFILGWVLEEIYGRSLFEIFESLKEENWAPKDFHFNPLGQPSREPLKSYAPTEDCPWRKKVLRGEVHDDNAWALGGVAPHAGLFGSLKGVQEIATAWRSVLLKGSGHPLKKRTLEKFIKRSLPDSVGDFGLGFMLPTKGKASCGKYFSAQSFGHTGFTGTSLWIDPVKDQTVVVLSNRVHPNREAVDFKVFRPWLHDLLLGS